MCVRMCPLTAEEVQAVLDARDMGRYGMWAKAIVEGRCLVPTRAFCEGHATEKVISEETGKPIRRQCRFPLPGARAILLAAVQQDGRFSIVTTEPKASTASTYDRMPLVLGPCESSVWLGPNCATFANRDAIVLSSMAEL